MKYKKVKKLIAIALSAAMIASLAACGTNTAAETKDAVQATTVTQEDDSAEELLTSALTDAATKTTSTEVGKEETVYVMADAQGAKQQVIVENWLKNGEHKDTLDDVSDLTDIENVKGDESFSSNGNSLSWEADGNDIYYKGTTSKEIPVSEKITYYLNGKEISPEKLAGQSGQVKIHIDYTNTQKMGDVYVPFTVMSGLVLSNDVASDVQVDHGKVISEGKNTIVVGVAFPGLEDSLNIDKSKLDTDINIPNSVEVTLNATNFEMATSMSLVLSDLISDETATDGATDKMDDMDKDINTLSDSSKQLVDGTTKLQDGTNTLNSKTGDLTSGAGTLDDGAKQLQSGANTLAAGVSTYTSGVDTLADGVKTYTSGTDSLASGVKEYTAGTSSLAGGVKSYTAGEEQVAAGIDALSSQTASLPDKVKELAGGLQSAADGANQIQAGLQQAESSASQLAAGAAGVDTGIGTIHDSLVQIQAGLANGTDVSGLIGTLQENLTTSTTYAQSALNVLTSGAVVDATDGSGALAGAIQALSGSIQVQQGIAKALAGVDLSNLSTLKTGIDALVAATGDGSELGDGATQVANGLGQLDAALGDNGAGTLGTGAKDLVAGMNVLNDGGSQLASASQSLVDGIGTLKAGSDQLTANNKTLTSGADQLTSASSQLNSGADQLTSASGQLTSGADQLQSNSSALTSGADTLASGTNELASGTTTLKDGTAQLVDGIVQLADGAITLKDGMVKFDKEGIQKLADAYTGDIQPVLDRLDEVKEAGASYKTFSGASAGTDSSVKFIIKTAGVTKDEN